jgi:hypothetical protein
MRLNKIGEKLTIDGVIQSAIDTDGVYIRADECEVFKNSGWVNGAGGDSDFLICELNTDNTRSQTIPRVVRGGVPRTRRRIRNLTRCAGSALPSWSTKPADEKTKRSIHI